MIIAKLHERCSLGYFDLFDLYMKSVFNFIARGPKSQEPSAVEELQALMLSVRESSGCAKENQDKLQDEQKTCKVESSMDVDVQKDKNSVTVPNLEMVEEPEEVGSFSL